tara:strand:+ start:1366 stop:1614 length:249 start_codon:yes stop_codon:yes gene_type:complete
MSASKIKDLIERFNWVYDELGYVECHINKVDKDSQEYEDMVDEINLAEDELYYLADEMKKLKPSQYMINKYPQILDILEDRY